MGDSLLERGRYGYVSEPERRLYGYGPEEMVIEDADELARLRGMGVGDLWRISEGKRVEALKNLGLVGLDFGLDLVGGPGDWKGGYEAITGRRRLLEGVPGVEGAERMNWLERVGAGVGALPGIPGVGGLLAGVKAARAPLGKVVSGVKQSKSGLSLAEELRGKGVDKVEGLEVRSKFGEKLSPEGKATVNWYNNHRGETSIHFNSKTGLSVDYSTNCPNRLNPSRGPCPYCYVEHGRVVDKLFNMKGANKGLFERDYGGEISAWPKDLIKELNKDGGLRMFSFADYRPQLDKLNVTKTLEDARKQGLYIKAITKEPQFVKEFGDHPNLRINISVDNVPRNISSNAPTIDEAIALKADRPNIKVRAVALNPKEAEMFSKDPRVDVVTLYHGLTNFDPSGKRHNKLLSIIMEQNPEMVKRIGVKALQDYTDSWVNMKKPALFDPLAKKFPTKICCQSGKCAGDKTKCGFGAAGGLLLAGVFLPIPDENE